MKQIIIYVIVALSVTALVTQTAQAASMGVVIVHGKKVWGWPDGTLDTDPNLLNPNIVGISGPGSCHYDPKVGEMCESGIGTQSGK